MEALLEPHPRPAADRRQASSSKSGANRLSYLDWLRGIAAVTMLNGHVFHSFSSKENREGSIYQLTQFMGGMPPAVFLFLTGITLAFLMDSSERKQLSLRDKMIAVLRRSGFLFAMAYLFRLQLWLFGWPNSPWTDLLKVDILNCMGLAIALSAGLSAFSTFERIRYGAILGIAVAAASPVVSAIDFTDAPLLRGHLAPNADSFSFFPWASFLFFGLAMGSVIRVAKSENVERVMQWSAVFGLAAAWAAHYFANIPYSIYTKSDFWLDSPAQVFIKMGIILVLLSFAYVWTRFVVRDSWNWICQLGTTSLLVYWVHIELVYGRWMWFWKDGLSVAQTLALSSVVIVSMVALSTLRTRWAALKAALPPFVYRPLGQPE